MASSVQRSGATSATATAASASRHAAVLKGRLCAAREGALLRTIRRSTDLSCEVRIEDELSSAGVDQRIDPDALDVNPHNRKRIAHYKRQTRRRGPFHVVRRLIAKAAELSGGRLEAWHELSMSCCVREVVGAIVRPAKIASDGRVVRLFGQGRSEERLRVGQPSCEQRRAASVQSLTH